MMNAGLPRFHWYLGYDFKSNMPATMVRSSGTLEDVRARHDFDGVIGPFTHAAAAALMSWGMRSIGTPADAERLVRKHHSQGVHPEGARMSHQRFIVLRNANGVVEAEPMTPFSEERMRLRREVMGEVYLFVVNRPMHPQFVRAAIDYAERKIDEAKSVGRCPRFELLRKYRSVVFGWPEPEPEPELVSSP